MQASERSMPHRFPLSLLLLLSLAALAASLPSRAETVGERFRRSMEAIRQDCIVRPPAPNNVRCDILKVQPFDPLATPEGRFAHQIQLPAQLARKVTYREGVSADAYFRELCEKDAGMFILRTVQDVPGVLQMRPRQLATQEMFEHLHGVEDPVGYDWYEQRNPARIFLSARDEAYQYLEVFGSSRKEWMALREPFIVLSGYKSYRDKPGGDLVQTPLVTTPRSSRTSRFGYTWREITDQRDRELGISGGETIVWDFEQSDVVSVLRGFKQTGNVRNRTGVWWEFGRSCPAFTGADRPTTRGDQTRWFVMKSLPRPQVASEAGGGPAAN